MNLYSRAIEVSELAHFGKSAFVEEGFDDVVEFYDEDTETQAYIVEDARYVYLTFAGAGAAEDAQYDDNFQDKKAFSDMGLHRGLWLAWRTLSGEIATEIMQRRMEMVNEQTTKKQVVYCGHSLGGSLAVIAAATHNPDFCLTFGSPPVGGRNFVKHINALQGDFKRFVLTTDETPHLLNFRPWYRHVGQEVLIDTELNLHFEPSFWEKLSLNFSSPKHSLANLIDSYRVALYHHKD